MGILFIGRLPLYAASPLPIILQTSREKSDADAKDNFLIMHANPDQDLPTDMNKKSFYVCINFSL